VFGLANSPSLSCTCLKLRELLALVMEGEGSPVIDIMGDAPKGPLSEASTASSSFDASSSGPLAMLLKSKLRLPWIHVNSRGAEFRASLVTVGRIRQMESLAYFTGGSACEPGEEIVSEPNSNEVVVFEEFFATGLQMPPHRVFIEILLKFQVQLHQLTLNAIVQMLKYF
jgi:hypothetical protein